MPPLKKNPLKLNALQLKTLTLLQVIAEDPEITSTDATTGEVTIGSLPHPHGDHFHVGHSVVSSRDASGLHNEGVWKALERKGLARGYFPSMITLTIAGLEYDTGLRDAILHTSGHAGPHG